MKAWQARVLEGARAGRPVAGPVSVHVDITNHCNAKCVTCWDHSPLLEAPRSAAWKKRRLDLDVLRALVGELAALGSVRHVVLSGMGEPLVHPDVYAMIALVKAQGWELTIISNLVAADIERLAGSGVDHLLVGVQGVTPETHAAFHPGWDERDFFTMCANLRRLVRAGVRCRHVHVIERHLAPEVVEMVRFGKLLGADRVNFKLASLFGGTEKTAITEDQRAWLLADGVPAARALAHELGVATNLDLFERQLRTHGRATVPIDEVGCFMGYAYTRITVDLDVLYCCNTNVRVGRLEPDGTGFGALWVGDAWNAWRDALRAGRYPVGCDRCGKFEQNVKWSDRLRAEAGEAAWAEVVGRAGPPRRRLEVL